MKPQLENKQQPKKKSRWHKWFFGGLYVVIVLALFGLFYNFVVRDDNGGGVDADGNATTGISVYDTLDVVGDYLWPGMNLDTSKDGDEDKKDNDKSATTQAAPVIEAEAATEQDIEDATGLTSNDPATSTQPAAPTPSDGNGEEPTVEAIE